MAAVQGMEGYSCDGCRCSAGAPAGLPYAIVWPIACSFGTRWRFCC